MLSISLVSELNTKEIKTVLVDHYFLDKVCIPFITFGRKCFI